VKRQDNGSQEPRIDNRRNAFGLILLKRNAAEVRDPSTGLAEPIDPVRLGRIEDINLFLPINDHQSKDAISMTPLRASEKAPQ
jgi:hypothetical protein